LHNFVKFPPTLVIFGVKIAKMILLCTVHLFTTSPNLSTHYRVKHRCSKLWHYVAIICIRWLTFASSIRQRVQRGLIILRY